LLACRATACTDVTGFGLLGHLLEMLRASDMNAALDPEAIPALDGAVALLGRGITSSLHADNVAAMTALGPGAICLTDPIAALLIDPQTAGGLLAGIPAEGAAACVAQLRGLDYRAAEIGFVTGAAEGEPRIELERGAAEARREAAVAS
jgi:selenide,water dikinase